MDQVHANEKPVPNSVLPNVGRNFFWMVWSGVISIANSVVLWIFLARMRDVEELGRFTIVMGIYALFISGSSLGLMPYLVNEISRRRERSGHLSTEVSTLISNAVLYLAAAGVAGAGLMTLIGLWESESRSIQLSTMILSLALIPSGPIVVAEAAAIAAGRTRLIAFVTSLENILRTIVPFALIWYGFDLPTICVAFVFVRLVALSIYIVDARGGWSRIVFAFSELRSLFKVTPTFGGTIILASINWQAAIILLGHLSTEAESAKYGAASRFLIPVTILMASYASVIQPRLSLSAQHSIRQMGGDLARMIRFPLVAALTAAVMSPFLSRAILVLLFGEPYADSDAILNLLAFCTIPFCIVMVVARGLVATGSQHIDLLANGAGVAACVVLGLILIPKYGAVGAAVAQLASLLIMAALEVGYLTAKIKGVRVWRPASIPASKSGLAG